jgi:hypothetical protein
MLLLDRPLRFTGDAGDPAGTGPGDPADPVLCELFGLTAAHLAYLPEQEAADRAALTARFLVSSLARWERDVQAGTEATTPLASFALALTDLAVRMLDAPSSMPPRPACPLRRMH